jgi:hypothetical protein
MGSDQDHRGSDDCDGHFMSTAMGGENRLGAKNVPVILQQSFGKLLLRIK